MFKANRVQFQRESGKSVLLPSAGLSESSRRVGLPGGGLRSAGPGAAGSGSSFRVWLARGCPGKLPRVSENKVDSSALCVRKVFFQLWFTAH